MSQIALQTTQMQWGLKLTRTTSIKRWHKNLITDLGPARFYDTWPLRGPVVPLGNQRWHVRYISPMSLEGVPEPGMLLLNPTKTEETPHQEIKRGARHPSHKDLSVKYAAHFFGQPLSVDRSRIPSYKGQKAVHLCTIYAGWVSTDRHIDVMVVLGTDNIPIKAWFDYSVL